MKRHIFNSKTHQNKRFILKATAKKLESIIRTYNLPTHIFEMALGPLD